MAIRLQILFFCITCSLGQHILGQVASSGDILAYASNYVIKANENVADKVKGKGFIQVSVDRKSCYIGEPIMLTYQFCTPFVNLFTLAKTPSFNGFSVVDMETPNISNYEQATIKGQSYKVYTLRKVQIYPMQAGLLLTDTVSIANTIYFIKQDYLLQQSGFQQNPKAYLNELQDKLFLGIAPSDAILTHKTNIANEPISINVKDYPAANKPASFNGATGQFNIAAAVSQHQLSTDEVGKLTVSISGKGNMMLVTAPDIHWPEGLEAFEPAVTDRVSHATIPISGSKFFEYRFTATKPGSYTLPPIQFSWFDVQKGSYQTAQTSALTIAVQQGNGQLPIADTIAEPAQEKFFNRLFANRWWVAGPVIALILLGLLLWLRSEHKKDKKTAAVAAISVATEAAKPQPTEEPANPLANSTHLLQTNQPGFYGQLNNDLRKYLSAKLQIPLAQLTKKTLVEALDKFGYGTDLAIEWHQLLEDIEWQLYTPDTDDAQKEALYQRSLAVIAAMGYRAQG